MDATLHALAGILLRAIPTFIIVVLLHFYIKRMFFRPLEKVLGERYKATEGTKQLADGIFARAAQKAADYDAVIRATKLEIYHEFEEQRVKWRQEHEAALQQARKEAREIVAQGKQKLDQDIAEAKRSLESSSESLAARIAEAMFQEKVN